MSKTGEIKEIMEVMFKDGKIHTSDEIIRIALNEKIITNEKDKAISNAIFQFKKCNPDFFSVGRGKYQKKVCGVADDELKKLNEQVEFIIDEIRKIKKFDWISCDEQALILERKKISNIKRIVLEYEKMVKSK